MSTMLKVYFVWLNFSAFWKFGFSKSRVFWRLSSDSRFEAGALLVLLITFLRFIRFPPFEKQFEEEKIAFKTGYSVLKFVNQLRVQTAQKHSTIHKCWTSFFLITSNFPRIFRKKRQRIREYRGRKHIIQFEKCWTIFLITPKNLPIFGRKLRQIRRKLSLNINNAKRVIPIAEFGAS